MLGMCFPWTHDVFALSYMAVMSTFLELIKHLSIHEHTFSTVK